MQKLLKISESLRQFFLKEEKDNKYNYFALAIAAGVGHIFFGFYWTYIDPQIYENLYLRSVGFLTCVILLSAAALKREESQNKWLYYYWIFTVIYNLPFFFTINLILNNFSDIWFVAEATMIFTTVLFLSSIILSLLTIFSGIFFAAIFCFFTSPNSIYFSQDIIKHLPIYSLTFIAAYVFSYSNNKGLALSKDVIYGQELKILKSLAGSIAHELRNPLNTINLIGSQIKDLAPEFDKTNVENSGDAKSKLLSLTSHITDATSNANNIINIILGDLSEKKINPEDFSYLNPAKALPEILEKYGYKNDEERAKINLLLPETGKENEEGNFLFKAVPDRFTYIIFNLLKNALYYLDQYPNSTITIGTDKKEVNGTQYNTIYIHDTGPGIATNAIPKLFGDFYTSGKKEGTGLGLAFCKRNMKLFGGDIICESELGKWTRFSLLFPILSKSEIELAKTESRKRKVLLVDDQEVNLITLKSKIERILPDISCDIAKGGKEAINMAKENKYHLILMDVQMPETNGVEAARKIRLHDDEVPIIALTSLSKELFLEEIAAAVSKKDFNSYLSKLSGSNLLYRTVSKWIMDLEDQLSYVGTKEEYLEVLKDKKAILADDERLNRMMTKRVLESSGLVVAEVNNGKELIELYKNSLDENHQSSFDIIITDINMPPHNGDEAAKEIRRLEAINKITHHDEMPIIALSGDGRKEDIHHFFECQMTDYFIKGGRPELLIRIVANYLLKKETGGLESSDADNKIPTNKNHTNRNHTINPHLNHDRFKHFTKEEQVSLLNLFIKDTDETISKIIESKNAGDQERTLFHLHTIKGTAANIGADKLFAYIKTIEPEIRSGNPPHGWFEGLEVVYSELEKEIGEILIGLR